MKKAELLAPVGSISKLDTALHFGADAVYLGGKNFGLRAFATNFDDTEMESAINTAHQLGKKVYVTVNIFAKNADFGELKEYVERLHNIKADAVIVSDPGVVDLVRKHFPSMEIHLSTQANTLNKYAVAFWRDIGVKRVVLARELNIKDIKEIKDYVGDSVELEAFVHGAMCISYSGRCLLSTYLTGRDSNRGECVQSCRWEYKIGEVSREDSLTLQEDKSGSYILNSKDMNTMPIIDKIIEAGVSSLKIEGRMKSEYYLACVIGAYRKRLDDYYNNRPYDENLNAELYKVNHREYTTGFYMGEAQQCYTTSKPDNDYRFCAEVIGYDYENKLLEVVQRNRFKIGERLEAVSPKFITEFVPSEIYDENGNAVSDCKIVQQRLFIKTDIALEKKDILREKINFTEV